MRDLLPAKTYCKLCKFISQELQGDKMKKFLIGIIIVTLPASIFAIGGLGLSVGQATFTVEASTSPLIVGDVEVGYFNHHGFENGLSFGGYLYLDIIPVVDLDIEVNAMGNVYDFSFYNKLNETLGLPPDTAGFVYGAANTYITIQKPVFELGIPFLAKAKLYAGAGLNKHVAIPMVNQEMLEAIVVSDDGLPDLENGEFDSEALETYLDKNKIEATGLHFQTGLQFRLLTFDVFAYYRYTLAKDIVPGNSGFGSMNFRLGLGI